MVSFNIGIDLLTWNTMHTVVVSIGPSRPMAETVGEYWLLVLLIPPPIPAVPAAAGCSGVGRTGA
jgi:hypothetical protein